jgi:hypothetical protein
MTSHIPQRESCPPNVPSSDMDLVDIARLADEPPNQHAAAYGFSSLLGRLRLFRKVSSPSQID